MEQVCVGIVITIMLVIATLLLGYIYASICNVEEDVWAIVMSYVTSVVGFGICLTIILYQNGLIQ